MIPLRNTLKRIVPLFFMLIFLSLGPASARSEDRVLTCSRCVEDKRDQLLGILGEMEHHFASYRWAESKIRWLYYEKLWAARREAADPLNKEKRRKGEKEAEFLERELSDDEALSLQASNGFIKKLQEFQEGDLALAACCPENEFKECQQTAFRPAYAVLDQGKRAFDHIFEHEREYREEVALTAGSKEGLYPLDALEKPELHQEYYWRFEAEREERRFQENQEMMQSLLDVRNILNRDFAGKTCCTHCGVTEWGSA